MVANKIKQVEYRRHKLPYGFWTCADGREVLFNRFYEPIVERSQPGGVPRPADPRERIPWITQEWFYKDATPESEKRRAGEAMLKAWGFEYPRTSG